VEPLRRDEAAEGAAEADADVGRDARDGAGAVAHLRRCERGHQRRLARDEPAVAGAGGRRGDERLRGRVRERQAGVAGGEREAGTGGRRTRAEAVDHRAGDGRGDDGEPRHRADDEARDPEAEAAALVQVDDLERQTHPDVLVIEDDYVARVAGAPYVPIHRADGRWAVVRSQSKVLGPDLRIAIAAGDPLTISRIEGRQRLGPGWVSHVLQQVAALMLKDRATGKLLARAQDVYSERRGALVSALAARGLQAAGDSGLGVWLPLADEAAAVRELLAQGWAVSPGERYRFDSPPGIRVTTAALEPDDAERLADAIAALGRAPASTYEG
jgi:hypothetical protein